MSINLYSLILCLIIINKINHKIELFLLTTAEQITFSIYCRYCYAYFKIDNYHKLFK